MNAFVGIDIGNTHTTVGWSENSAWVHEWRLATKARRTKDEWTVLLEGVLRRGGYPARTVKTIAISSVVPVMTENMIYAGHQLGIEPVVINHGHVRSLKIAYDPPSAVGPDRLCGVAAAIHRFGVPVVVVDLGTATVIDVVDENRVYRGGIIAPGVATAAESLHQTAALLPQVDLAFPPSIIGDNTQHAIQSGILNGALAMIDGLVSRIHAEVGKTPVIATGGFADILNGHSTTISHVNQKLVLDGIRLLATGEWS